MCTRLHAHTPAADQPLDDEEDVDDARDARQDERERKVEGRRWTREEKEARNPDGDPDADYLPFCLLRHVRGSDPTCVSQQT